MLACWIEGARASKISESLDQVLPLKEQLRRTDALIDQVVYRCMADGGGDYDVEGGTMSDINY